MGDRSSSQTMPSRRDGVLIFDGECGFCTWAAEWARRRLPAGARVVPWQLMDDLAGHGPSVRDVESAVHWIDARGRPHRGHEAVMEALRAMGGGWGVLGNLMRARPVDRLAAGVYEVVARNRHRLPGSTPACRRR